MDRHLIVLLIQLVVLSLLGLAALVYSSASLSRGDAHGAGVGFALLLLVDVGLYFLLREMRRRIKGGG